MWKNISRLGYDKIFYYTNNIVYVDKHSDIKFLIEQKKL